MDFRTFVLEWLERRGWSRARLAEAAGLSQSLVSKYLADDERRRVMPSPDSLAKLAPVMDATLEDLMRLCGYLPGDFPQVVDEGIEQDVKARLAEYLAAVRDTPRWAWTVIINSTFDRAIDSVRDWAEVLDEQSTVNRVADLGSDRASKGHSIGAKTRRQRPIKPLHQPAALLA